MSYLTEDASRIRAYLPAGTDVPAGADDLFLIYAVLGRAKGTTVTAEDVHDAWVAWMETQGEKHRSMQPFADLNPETQAEDEPFADAIRRAFG